MNHVDSLFQTRSGTSPSRPYRKHVALSFALIVWLFVSSVSFVEAASISDYQEYPKELATQAQRALPFWSPSVLPELTWFLGDRLDDRPALLFPPLKSAGLNQAPESAHQVSLFNANLWLLPFPFARDHGQRLYDVIAMIDRLNPDIVTLQEVWLYSHIEPLRSSLPEYWMVLPPLDIFNKTGLVIFSRHRPTRVTYGTFGRTWLHNPIEHLAGKGYLRASFDEPQTFDLLCSHAYAPKGKHERAITDNNVLHLCGLMESSARPIVLAGDLNTKVPRLQELLTEGYAWEADLETRTQARPDGKKIDYVLGRAGTGTSLAITSQVLFEPLVSDHLPLIATVTFTPR